MHLEAEVYGLVLSAFRRFCVHIWVVRARFAKFICVQ